MIKILFSCADNDVFGQVGLIAEKAQKSPENSRRKIYEFADLYPVESIVDFTFRNKVIYGISF